MNILVHTDDLKPAFEKIKALPAVRENSQEWKAGYRDFEDDEYPAVYPDGLRHLSVF
jgi:hypothetical protein